MFTTKGDTLLKLRKVEIVGFKSFCDRTVVTFSGNGTTCIVGPNGCGKSNVVDAISWVLGGRRHKSINAGRMSDCIFNGTMKRPPMGLAEVTITMEDPELAEAARFVLENSAPESISESAEESAEAIIDLTSSIDHLTVDPAVAPEESVPAVADTAQEAASPDAPLPDAAQESDSSFI